MSVLLMRRPQDWLTAEGYFEARVVVAVTSAVVVLAGVGLEQPAFVAAGAVGLCVASRLLEQYAAAPKVRMRELANRLLNGCGPYAPDGSTDEEFRLPEKPRLSPPPARPRRPAIPRSTNGLVDEMLRTGRYALLLRTETAGHLATDEYQAVIAALDDRMSITPDGTVLTGMAAERATLGETRGVLASVPDEGIVRVGASYLDRWTVSNEEFQHFVDAGGYEQLEFWPEEALPAIFDFVDTTGASAPRYWANGQFPAGQQRRPVVGVSWYEAYAYARWVGKRLPGDPEWTKACAWPIESAPGRIAQRRYPWGESFDARRANLWCAEHGQTVDIDSYPEGATVGGLEQMVGNVWEWTRDGLDEATPDSLRFPSALRSIRGGAYNTYFENQATCHFQSGEHPLARRANIGIRLALDMAGLASPAPVDV